MATFTKPPFQWKYYGCHFQFTKTIREPGLSSSQSTFSNDKHTIPNEGANVSPKVRISSLGNGSLARATCKRMRLLGKRELISIAFHLFKPSHQWDQIWRNFATWQHFMNLRQMVEGLLSVWPIFELSLAKLLCFGAAFPRCTWPSVEK